LLPLFFRPYKDGSPVAPAQMRLYVVFFVAFYPQSVVTFDALIIILQFCSSACSLKRPYRYKNAFAIVWIAQKEGIMGGEFRTFLRYAGMFIIFLAAVALSGCRVKTIGPPAESTTGSTGGTTAQLITGSVSQGAVRGAAVFGDHLTGSGANNKLDNDEAATAATTSDNGLFTINTPGYAHVLVSMGGTDSLTGLPAMLMCAPAGSRNITPFTTLVCAHPSVQATIESLGISYDANLSTALTPASALVVLGIQMSAEALCDVLNPNGTTLPTTQVNAIQEELLAQIASQIENQSISTLTTPATLSALLQTAILNTLITIDANMTNITISNPTAVASAIAQAIMTVETSAGATGTGTTPTVPENTIITAAIASAVVTQCDAAAATATAGGGVSVTAPINAAPTITGTPGTTATLGQTYSFKPSVIDTDNDALLFSIVNKPSWASFNTATGTLSGTPTASGSTGNIVISVSDGMHTVSLPAFTLTVGSSTGSTGGTGGTL
jgi:putative Ig domain-containing protein